MEDRRLLRERQILEALGDGLRTIPEMVARIYVDVSTALHGAAAPVRAVLPHEAQKGRQGSRGGRPRPAVSLGGPVEWEP